MMRALLAVLFAVQAVSLDIDSRQIACYDLSQAECTTSIYCTTRSNDCVPWLTCLNLNQEWCQGTGSLCSWTYSFLMRGYYCKTSSQRSSVTDVSSRSASGRTFTLEYQWCLSGTGYRTPFPEIPSCSDGFCLNRGTARWVEVSPLRNCPDLCKCSCRNYYSGFHCEQCPPQFHNDCSQCVRPNVSPDKCTPCDVIADCSQHAGSVFPDPASPTGCRCQCTGHWGGTKCDTCPSQYDQQYCDRCAAGHVNYPTCQACTAAYCSGRAVEVKVNTNLDTCECVCQPGFTGSRCEQCPAGYIGGAALGCTQCTPQVHCNGRADADKVTDVNRQSCVCTACHDQWEGTQCDLCDPQGTRHFDMTTCNKCKSGYVGYPNCKLCEVATHCTGHASSVSAVNGVCQCVCSLHWTGLDCSVCPSQVSQAMCDKCLPGYFGPKCDKCDIATHCSGRASSVTSRAPFDMCECSCKDKWTGAMCDKCPPQYDPVTCAACREGLDGYTGYPTCTQCTTATSCSGNADSVTAQAGQCKCKCRNLWTGGKCESCDAKYAGDCNVCAPNRVKSPDCVECTVATDCNGRATAVQATADATQCLCQCNPGTGWSGAACDVCPSHYKGTNCNECAGWGTFPTCTGCTADAHCNGRATSVNQINGMCSCTCADFWTGARCDLCNVPHIGAHCDQCMDGYTLQEVVGTPGMKTCVACTCGVGGTATTTPQGECACKCRDQWDGQECDVCPSRYEKTKCRSCAADHVMYPLCSPCTYVCGPYATSATATAQQAECTCVCADQWKGLTCRECAPEYDATTCNKCAAGWVNYPSCEMCSVVAHCSGHAASVKQEGASCVCTCRNKWQGTTCNECPAPFGGVDCDACLPGSVGFPACKTCDLNVACVHAVSVWSSGQEDLCQCDCKSPWSGHDCSICDAPYGGTDCDACLPGYVGYPNCEQCSLEETCGGRGLGVAVVDGQCTCTCQSPWAGEGCRNCTEHFAGDACDQCAPGLFNYPLCQNCNEHCSPVGGTPITDGGQCNCTCHPGYVGETCAECAHHYARSSKGRCWSNTTLTAPETTEPKVSVIPEDQKEAFQQAKTGGSIAGALSGPSTAFSGAKLGVFMSLCHGTSDAVLDPEITPLGLSIGSGTHSEELGGVVGNAILMVAALALQSLVLLLVYHRQTPSLGASFDSVDGDSLMLSHACATARFPYLSLFVVIFLYHGMATCGLKLMLFAEGAGERFVGIATVVLFNLGFLVMVFVKVRRLTEDAVYSEKPGGNCVSVFMFGRGEWVSSSQKEKVKSWGILFEMYRSGWSWFLIPECVILLAITVIQVLEAKEIPTCRTLAGVLSGFFGAYALMIAAFRPWASLWDNLTFGILSALECTAMGLLTRSFSDALAHSDKGHEYMMSLVPETPTFGAAGILLQVITYLTFVKGIVDPLLLLYVEWSRRKRVQSDYDHCQARKQLTPEEMHMQPLDEVEVDPLVFQNALRDKHLCEPTTSISDDDSDGSVCEMAIQLCAASPLVLPKAADPQQHKKDPQPAPARTYVVNDNNLDHDDDEDDDDDDTPDLSPQSVISMKRASLAPQTSVLSSRPAAPLILSPVDISKKSSVTFDLGEESEPVSLLLRRSSRNTDSSVSPRSLQGLLGSGSGSPVLGLSTSTAASWRNSVPSPLADEASQVRRLLAERPAQAPTSKHSSASLGDTTLTSLLL